MTTIELLIWLLALAIAIHTIAESSTQQIAAGRGFSALFDSAKLTLRERAVWLDNLPIFIALVVGAVAGSYWSLFAGILPAVAITHPFLDHVALSYSQRRRRPGTGTALLLMLPLGGAFYGLAYQYRWLGLVDILVSGAIGLGISLLLLWLALKFPDAADK